MPSLLSLPREIRDRILEYALYLPVQEPPESNDLKDIFASRKEIRREQSPLIPLKSWTVGRDVLYPKSSASPIHPIFLVNTQIHSEAKDALSRLPANYILDVVLYREVYLIPTWLVMPHPRGSVPSCIDSVTCRFRTAFAFDKPPSSYSGFQGGDGGGPAMSWVLYSLLERFFYFGPHWHGSKTQTIAHFVIEVLHIEIQTPLGNTSQQFIREPCSVSRLRSVSLNNGPSAPILHPEFLFYFAKRYIFGLLSMGYHTAGYGDMLFTHLGSIIFTLYGKRESEADVADILKRLNNQYDEATTSRKQRRKALLNWKPRAMAARKRRGLRWLEFPDWDGSDLEYLSYDACHREAIE